MTQTHIKHQAGWPVPVAPGLKLMDWVAIGVSGLGCVFALLAGLGPSGSGTTCVVICVGFWFVFSILWPILLVRHYWRRVHVGLRLAWLPFGYITIMALALNLAMVTDEHLFLTTRMVVWVYPGIAVALAILLHKKRGDTILFLELIPEIPLVLASAGSLVYFQMNPDKDGFGIGSAFSLIMLVGGAIQLLAVVIGLVVLKYRGLYGTSPSWSHLCAQCEYDLTGTVAGEGTQCPECGKPIANEQAALVRKRIQAQEPGIQEPVVP